MRNKLCLKFSFSPTKDGNGSVSDLISADFGSNGFFGSGMISHPRFSGSGPEIYRVWFWVWFFTNGYPMDQIIVYNKNSYFIVYLIITLFT